MRVLDVDVPDELLHHWRRLLAPEWQPFFVGPDEGISAKRTDDSLDLPDDLRCTFTAWRVTGATAIAWLDEASFMGLPRRERAGLVRTQVDLGRGAVPTVRRWQDRFDARRLRAQADGHRFVWWPSLLDENPEPVLRAQVEDGQLPSRHREVHHATWQDCERVVPGARSIVGAFPASSGPNCFGATLAAAGHAAPGGRTLQDRFDSFLAEHCEPGGRDDDAGTVLVWRERTGLPFHSAVTIGDGWGIEKPAETWWTPTIVADTRDLVRANRAPGLRLERHRIVLR